MFATANPSRGGRDACVPKLTRTIRACVGWHNRLYNIRVIRSLPAVAGDPWLNPKIRHSTFAIGCHPTDLRSDAQLGYEQEHPAFA
jgi:hypothetical protein